MNDMPVDKTFTATHEMPGKCPFGGDRVGGAFGTPPTLENWYPGRLRVELLHQNGLAADPLGADFDYAAAFAKLDFEALKRDIKQFLTTPVAWWPADYGNYGPQMIRMAWHAAGTYRIADGRGGAGTAMQRFAPKATRNDLVFGSNAQLRSIADVYAGSDGHPRFVRDFIKAWDKVMMLDRYDIKGHRRYGSMAA